MVKYLPAQHCVGAINREVVIKIMWMDVITQVE